MKLKMGIRMITITTLVKIILIMSFSDANAQDSLKTVYRNKKAPSSVNMQYAGNTGMFSLGASYMFLVKRIYLDCAFGYVPKLDAEKPIYIASLKGIYNNGIYHIINGHIFYPFSFGLAISYTFGNEYNRYLDRNKYPKGYYWWNTAFRFGFCYQAEIYSVIDYNHLEGISTYLEFSWWDMDIYSYTGNSNKSYLSVWDITTLGIGARLYIF